MRDDCIFCKIANGEIPSATLYEDEDFRVILDLGPASKGHALAGKMGRAMKKALHFDGFNLVQNNGEAAGQTVMHFHMHMIPRYANGPQMVLWNPGKLDDTEKTEIIEKVKKELE